MVWETTRRIICRARGSIDALEPLKLFHRHEGLHSSDLVPFLLFRRPSLVFLGRYYCCFGLFVAHRVQMHQALSASPSSLRTVTTASFLLVAQEFEVPDRCVNIEIIVSSNVRPSIDTPSRRVNQKASLFSRSSSGKSLVGTSDQFDEKGKTLVYHRQS
ncbi:uncharacterized protein BJX67DRAFT_90001 [Aspergillus lucknowensis]|uniref:Uncharacterized protein n=1 Tax=Aspergillus lucknowensis TaxID=176173 RepID=A0ABR4M5H6_9EURO